MNHIAGLGVGVASHIGQTLALHAQAGEHHFGGCGRESGRELLAAALQIRQGAARDGHIVQGEVAHSLAEGEAQGGALACEQGIFVAADHQAGGLRVNGESRPGMDHRGGTVRRNREHRGVGAIAQRLSRCHAVSTGGVGRGRVGGHHFIGCILDVQDQTGTGRGLSSQHRLSVARDLVTHQAGVSAARQLEHRDRGGFGVCGIAGGTGACSGTGSTHQAQSGQQGVKSQHPHSGTGRHHRLPPQDRIHFLTVEWPRRSTARGLSGRGKVFRRVFVQIAVFCLTDHAVVALGHDAVIVLHDQTGIGGLVQSNVQI